MNVVILILLFLTLPVFAATEIESCLQKWSGQVPLTLSETCLFTDIRHGVTYKAIKEFTPRYPLYTDGMSKRRWIYIPEGQKIDNSDIANWNFPKGTILWKEFSNNGIKLETRMLIKTKEGQDKHNWTFATFQWRENQSDADAITEGATDVLGTIHDIPSLRRCMPCHHGSKDTVLGFEAIQLSFTDAHVEKDHLYLKKLVQEKFFTHQMGQYYKIPAKDSRERSALGYMHGNCSHCHNENHPAGRNIGMHLKSKPSFTTRDEHDALKTTVNVPTKFFQPVKFRVVPGKIQESALHHRLNSNTPGIMMAPIGRKLIDHDGVKLIKNWINSL